MPFIQSNLASFPDDFFCRIPTTRSNLATRKMSRPYETVIPSVLERHLANLNNANPASQDRKHSPSNTEYRLHRSAHSLDRTEEAQHLQLEPRPLRGKGAIEKHIAGKWHIIALQEAIEYLDREYLTNRFCVTHYGGCAVLLNKDTFHPYIKVTSVYLHDARVGSNVS